MTEELLNKLTDFIQTHLPYKDREKIKDYILQHEKFQTIDYAIDKGEVIGVCRWNIIDKDTAHILDLAIREDWRKKGLARDFLIRGLQKWNIKYLVFERETRGDKRKRMLPVDVILKRNIF
uniref:Putative acetyltransferase n=1 Tax=viral metagenome TaxID=1070528 RepID=A0A6H1ZYY9_9ZZZZ